MYLITPEKMFQAVQKFDQLPQHPSSQQADTFFGTIGPGNIEERIDRPYERFHDYEMLLLKLQKHDPEKYKLIHKGTPFYFLAWTAFDMRNYEEALFYMDSAISEDKRKSPETWLEQQQAGRFLLLEAPEDQVAGRIASYLNEQFKDQIARFNKIPDNIGHITKQLFVDLFVKELVLTLPETRSIITAFYTFILEYQERYNNLVTRSGPGGSIEPFVTHLFKGGLIFESLLKSLYPRHPENRRHDTLSRVFSEEEFQKEFGTGFKTKADSIRDIRESIKLDANDLRTAFETTARLRNTTGHKLTWEDIFDDPNNYRILFEQEVNAVFYIVQRRYLYRAIGNSGVG